MAMWVMAVVGAVPVFFVRGEADDVALVDFFDVAALALHQAASGGYDQGLAERVGVPGGAGAGLEGDAGARGARGDRRFE